MHLLIIKNYNILKIITYNLINIIIISSYRAVGDMMSTLFLPILPYVLQIVMVCTFCVTLVFLASTEQAHHTWQCEGKEGTCCKEVQVSTIFFFFGKKKFPEKKIWEFFFNSKFDYFFFNISLIFVFSPHRLSVSFFSKKLFFNLKKWI